MQVVKTGDVKEMTKILYNRAVKLFMDKISAGFDEYGAHEIVMNKYGKPLADKILSEAKGLEKQIRGNPRGNVSSHWMNNPRCKHKNTYRQDYELSGGTIYQSLRCRDCGREVGHTTFDPTSRAYLKNPRKNVSSHWMVHYPGEVYANDLRFNKPASKREVLDYLRRFHNVKRLTRGTEVWIA